ncbi:hypothetical protein [Olleya namhaensis]|uniref:Lipoprotein n=1 Tax=Olleya namhaensis TaxID=1144750 RepID=A0A1I3TBJ7_9FLAO|nr:hypothetical protein [Olleya namhaensis]SFJ67101.1 hypothetical protein SAMN05443431_1168 [Olleya namhaensis]
MKGNLIRIILILLTLTSCNNRVIADFEIINSTGIKIDSLKIEPMVVSEGKFISLKPNEKAEYKADMTGIAKVDGSYMLSYQQNGETFIKNFGYYSNGYPSDYLTRIEIEKDTLKFEAEFEKY